MYSVCVSLLPIMQGWKHFGMGGRLLATVLGCSPISLDESCMSKSTLVVNRKSLKFSWKFNLTKFLT